MKILVTGGAGFIGSSIADLFISKGHEVVIVDDLSTGKIENIDPRAEFYELDIREKQLNDLFYSIKPQIVCHQAARANVRESFKFPIEYADVNVLGSLNVLECCRIHKVQKIIYASTGGAVYGEPESIPVKESHRINPLDPYGASKHHVEHYLSLYDMNFDLRFTVLRYPNVFGPRQDPYGEAGVVAIFTMQMLRGEVPIINGTGDQERDFVFIDDVARANFLALEAGDGKILNIGRGYGTSINEITDRLVKYSGYSGIVQRGPEKDGEVFKICLDAADALQSLGWTPEISLEDGLSKTVEFFRTQLRS